MILKIKIIKAGQKVKKDKYLIYNSQDSFAKFKDINEFKELSLYSMNKRLNYFPNRYNKLKIVNPQTDESKNVKDNVLSDIGGIFNELYYI